ncbi:hypothetical protein [Paenibacillus pini]|uniref:hypothetical protein n=1 Tax=Paenibacillus pini TaxID=669461 RepID=UPI00056002F1|nr:hypothetical protein [Paenibacillus pini]
MPKKLLYIVVSYCVIIILAGCSVSQQDTQPTRLNHSSSPVMKDVYPKTVPSDVYSQKNVTPP